MSTPEPDWLSEEEQHIWRSWLLATSQLTTRLTSDLRRWGLDLAEYEVLATLSEAPGRTLRMSDLAAQARQSRSRLTHTVARMERRGLITRTASKNDRRGVTAVLTDEGLVLLQEAAPEHVTAVRRWLVDAMSSEEYRALGVACERIIEAESAEG